MECCRWDQESAEDPTDEDTDEPDAEREPLRGVFPASSPLPAPLNSRESRSGSKRWFLHRERKRDSGRISNENEITTATKVRRLSKFQTSSSAFLNRCAAWFNKLTICTVCLRDRADSAPAVEVEANPPAFDNAHNEGLFAI